MRLETSGAGQAAAPPGQQALDPLASSQKSPALIPASPVVEKRRSGEAGAALSKRRSSFPAEILASSLVGTNGFTIYGRDKDDNAGGAVLSGDVNGDGYADVIVSASSADGPSNSASKTGEVYVVFGNASGFGASIEASSLNGTNGFTIYGRDADDEAGISVSSGDVNGDGYADVLVGAGAADGPSNSASNTGEVYVVFGNASGFGASIEVSSLDGTNGFTIYGRDVDDYASSVSSGDVNGDGYADVLVGALAADSPSNSVSRTGEVYVVLYLPPSCSSSYYSSSGREPCSQCATQCAAETYEATACTATTNLVCSACATCAAETYETTACTSSTNRVCSAPQPSGSLHIASVLAWALGLLLLLHPPRCPARCREAVRGTARRSSLLCALVLILTPALAPLSAAETVGLSASAVCSDGGDCTWKRDGAGLLTKTSLGACTCNGTLDFSSQSLTRLDPAAFEGVGGVSNLYIYDNQLTSIPSGILDPLTDLTVLAMGYNKITTLPSGLFNRNTGLFGLWLYSNELTSLPPGIFDMLTGLERLYISTNPGLVTVPFDIFASLQALSYLELQSTALSCYPPVGSGIIPNGFDSQQQECPCDEGSYYNGSWCASCASPQTASFLGASSADDCVCPADTYLDGGSCAACPWGSSAVGSTQLGDCKCPADAYLDGASCIACPLGYVSAVGSTQLGDCKCPADTYPDGGSCIACPSPFGSAAGSTQLGDCNLCQSDTYLDGASCTACPPGAVSAEGSTQVRDCKCPADTYLDGASCTACPLPFKSAAGSTQLGDCNLCPADTYLDSRSCTTCPWGSSAEGSTHLGDCKCPADTYLDGGSCAACPWGSSAVGSTQLGDCKCPVGTYLDGGQCTTCPVGSTSPTGSANASQCSQIVDTYFSCSRGGTCSWNKDRTGHLTKTSPLACDCSGYLFLGDKGISSLDPDAFKGVVGVNGLALINNQLTTLPSNIFDTLTDLQYVDLTNNKLTALPSSVFDRLTGLGICYLSNNKLTALPSSIFDKTILTRLDLAINLLTALPGDCFDQLPSLQRLDLNDNQLTVLPSGIFNWLTSLQILNLHKNQLTALPSGCFDQLTSLQRLLLNDNKLTVLPSGVFDQLISLQILYLHNNQLTALSSSAFNQLTSLQTLDLKNNQLTALPSSVFHQLTGLQTLDLQSNQLTALPSSFDKLTGLQTLDLASNQLTALPSSFDKLTGLQWLDLANNQLTALPSRVFNQLTGLIRLYLNDNLLNDIDFLTLVPAVANCMLDLRVYNNPIQNLSLDFFYRMEQVRQGCSLDLDLTGLFLIPCEPPSPQTVTVISDALRACECLSGKYLPEGNSSCKSCSTICTVGQALCPYDFERDDVDECFACPAGTRMDASLEVQTCSPCPENTFQGMMGSESCLECPQGSQAPEGSAECTCMPGFVSDPERKLRVLAGSGYSAYPSPHWDGVGNQATFSSPGGLAVTPDNRWVLVADSGNHIVRQVYTATGATSTLAGTPGVQGYMDGSSSVALFSSPEAIAVDRDGQWAAVSESSCSIRLVWLGDGWTRTLAGSPLECSLVDGVGNSSRFTAGYKSLVFSEDGVFLYVGEQTSQLCTSTSTRYTFTVRKVTVSAGQTEMVFQHTSTCLFSAPVTRFILAQAQNDTVWATAPWRAEGLVRLNLMTGTEEGSLLATPSISSLALSQDKKTIFWTSSAQVHALDPATGNNVLLAGTGQVGGRLGPALDGTFRNVSGIALTLDGELAILAVRGNHRLVLVPLLNCTMCPSGTFTDTPGSTFCGECQPFSYTAGRGSSRCKVCPEGAVCPDGECALRNLPARCTSGNEVLGDWSGFDSTTLQFVLSDCPPGSELVEGRGDRAVNQRCKVCDRSHEYILRSGLDSCTACPPGLACTGTSNFTVKVEGSRWKQKDGVLLLIECPDGYRRETRRDGQGDYQECLPCPLGYQCNGPDCNDCTKCPRGTFKTSLSSEKCMQCPANTYNGQEGGTSFGDCLPCPEGSNTNSLVGRTSLTACACQSCAAGQWCKASWYKIALNTSISFVCEICPSGAECNGFDLRAAGGMDAVWIPSFDGRFYLRSCPTGHKMVSILGRQLSRAEYESQECRPCGPGMYIFKSDSPDFDCIPCPTGAVCPNGGPPLFDVQQLSISFSINAAFEEASPLNTVAFKAALASLIGVSASVIEVSLTVPQRRQGGAVSSVLVTFSAEKSEADALTQSIVAFSADMANILARNLVTSTGVPTSVVAGQVSVVERAVEDGWAYEVDVSTGLSLLRACPRGSIIVNSTADPTQWTCQMCELSTYSIDFTDGCMSSTCPPRECNSCPKGAMCFGGSSFNSSVAGSVWEQTYRGARMLLRIAQCPRGFVLVRDQGKPQDDECVPCPGGTYSLDAASFSSGAMVSSSAAVLERALDLCLPCPQGASLCYGSQVLPRQGFWRGDDMSCDIHMCSNLSGLCELSVCSGVAGGEGSRDGYGMSASANYKPRRLAMVYRCPPGVCVQNFQNMMQQAPTELDSTKWSVESNVCEEGHRGLVCSLCAEGHTLQSGTCVFCADQGSGWRETSIIAIVLILLVVLYFFSWRPVLQDTESWIAAQLWSQLQACMGCQDQALTQFTRLKTSLLAVSSFLAQFHQRGNGFFKIFLSFWQVVASFDTNFNLEWPPLLKQVWQAAGSVLEIDVLSFPGIACLASGITYQQSLIAATVGMYAVLAILALPVCVSKAWKMLQPERASHVHTRTCNQFFSVLMVALFSMYPFVSASVVSTFSCSSLGSNGTWLRKDFSVECPTPGSFLWLYSIFFTLFVPVLVPVFIYVVLKLQQVPSIALRKREDSLVSALLDKFVVQEVRAGLAYTTECAPNCSGPCLGDRKVLGLVSSVRNLSLTQLINLYMFTYECNKQSGGARGQVAAEKTLEERSSQRDVSHMSQEPSTTSQQPKRDSGSDMRPTPRPPTIESLCDLRLPGREESIESFSDVRLTCSDEAQSGKLSLHVDPRPPESKELQSKLGLGQAADVVMANTLLGPADNTGDASQELVKENNSNRLGLIGSPSQQDDSDVELERSGSDYRSEISAGSCQLSLSPSGQEHDFSYVDDFDAQQAWNATVKAAARLQRQGILDVKPTRWDQDAEEDVVVLNSVGFLIDSYKPDFWWFEIYELVRKFVSTSVVIFAWEGSIAQIWFALIWTFITLMIAMVLKPHAKDDLTAMNIFSLITQFATLIVGLLLKEADGMNDQGLGGSEKTLFGIIILFMHCFIFFVPFCVVGMNVKFFRLKTETSTLRDRSKFIGFVAAVPLLGRAVGVSSMPGKRPSASRKTSSVLLRRRLSLKSFANA